ncbi:MFS transporter [Burkholderia sp. MS455]|uniref:Putative MFS family arabinose efflux permease n=1 Tax=Burkholderia pyrrocinia TaxID=60550 RepID=A0A318ICJ4_BURPY|nr:MULTISPECIES: MFS transporter [Burkholderia]PXX22541.1 putative MFS family arabinose efflux permease [Burkholderia pyrrocinia]QRR05573.1 MFS transporter [Burkholderia sp. MS455]SFW46828.1 Predicted arabinose efflux permease, MFS family [Burkholderia sp. NFACC33-1]SFY04752.1 Predicted arabinose efflux permease, MFS family [Burkholderia sp. NFPP32]
MMAYPRTMSPRVASFGLLGALLTACGYGATFLLSMHFRSAGGNDVDTGAALAEAMVGTLIGLPLVAWLAHGIGAARTTALAALIVGAGVVGFAVIGRTGSLSVVPGLLVGVGWGGFYLAAPMMLAERTTDAERERWFLRFGSFQMAGVGGGPAVAALAIRNWHWTTGTVFCTVGGLCAMAALMLECFGRLSPAPLPVVPPIRERWLREIRAIARTHAIYPIAIIALGSSVFSGLMTFQMSMAQETGVKAGTFFGLYSATVVVTRWLLGAIVIQMRVSATTQILLGFMILSVAVTFAVPHNTMLHSVSAVLLGTGYGLIYPIVQAQAVNSTDARHRHAVLTWFVASYFVGVFGFPAVGGLVLVSMGKTTLLLLIAACGLAALLLSIVEHRKRASLVAF